MLSFSVYSLVSLIMKPNIDCIFYCNTGKIYLTETNCSGEVKLGDDACRRGEYSKKVSKKPNKLGHGQFAFFTVELNEQ